MTVLFVAHYSGFYGANKSLLTLMVLLRQHYGVKPLVLLPNKGAMCSMLEEQGIKYYVYPYYWWVNYNHGLFQWALNKRKQWINCGRVKKICACFKDEGIDLVYSNSVCVNMGYLIAKRLGLPHVWQFRESLTQFSLSFSLSLSRSLAILSSKVNKRYVLISDYMMSYYRKYLPEEKMVRIYNGVDSPEGVSRKVENELRGRLQVACVGVISDQKNQMELLQAQSMLHKCGIDIDSWFLGTCSDSEYYERLKVFVKAEGLTDMVHFVGHTDKVFDFLQKMNLGVVVARDEAFGRVTVEYMLMKMPVIVSRSGASPELVKPGVTGEVYELGDVGALANCIEKYCLNPELLVSQGEAASSEAVERFSAERNAEQIFEVIQDVIKS